MHPDFLFILLVISLSFLALLVFLKLQKSRVPSRSTKDTFDNLPLSQWAHLKVPMSLKIHYVQWGRGPDILLIHGIGASAYCWRFLGPKLAQNYRVTAIDLPGFGLSDKNPDLGYSLSEQSNRLIDFCHHLKIRPTLIVGSSMGGLIALFLAAQSPEFCNKVVALAPALNRYLVPLPIDAFYRVAPFFHKKIEPRTIQFLLKRVVSNPLLITEQDIQNYLKPYQGSSMAAITFTKSLKTIRDKRNPAFLKSLDSHAIILHGKSDKIVPIKTSRRALRLSKHLKLFEHPTAGHHLQEDSSDWVREKIESYLKTF